MPERHDKRRQNSSNWSNQESSRESLESFYDPFRSSDAYKNQSRGTSSSRRDTSTQKYNQWENYSNDQEEAPEFERGSARYGEVNRYSRRPQKKFNVVPLLVLLASLIAVGGGIFLYLENRTFTVNVNGTSHELKGLHTISSLVNDGYAQPQPGDMLAIDGSIFKQGGGDAFEVTVNGKPEDDPKRKLSGNEIITISDGDDVTEPIKETTEAAPFQVIEEGSGPVHVFEGEGADGSRFVRTGTLSGIRLEEETQAPQNVIYRRGYPATGGEKVIALTFDDGPWPETTAQILDILAEHQVKATFFVVGELVDQSDANRALVKRIHDEGHQVATHTYSHARGSGKSVDIGLMPPEERINEVTRGYDAIEGATGQAPSHIFRAPGGNFNNESQRILEPYVEAEIGWTIDTADWRQPGVDEIAAQIMSIGPGGIALMHDGGGNRRQTVEALKKALPHLKQQGYTFVTVDELLSYPLS